MMTTLHSKNTIIVNKLPAMHRDGELIMLSHDQTRKKVYSFNFKPCTGMTFQNMGVMTRQEKVIYMVKSTRAGLWA